MATPTLLIYNPSPFSMPALAALCARQGIVCREVRPCEYALPIGALAGIPVASPADIAPQRIFSDGMLVMCHMLSDQLDAFLSGMREAGLPRVALKAVLTPTNVAWSSLRLHDELAREHEALRGGRQGM